MKLIYLLCYRFLKKRVRWQFRLILANCLQVVFFAETITGMAIVVLWGDIEYSTLRHPLTHQSCQSCDTVLVLLMKVCKKLLAFNPGMNATACLLCMMQFHEKISISKKVICLHWSLILKDFPLQRFDTKLLGHFLPPDNPHFQHTLLTMCRIQPFLLTVCIV